MPTTDDESQHKEETSSKDPKVLHKDLYKRRAALRAWVTRSKNSLIHIIGQPFPEESVIRAFLSNLDIKMDNLKACQAEWETKLEIEDLDAEIDVARAFEEDPLKARLKAI
jgi:hypothetical protein